MRPLAFNLKDAKKIAGDKKSSTFALKGGHQITVAHGQLSPEHRKMIEKLPIHLATGGDPSKSTPIDNGDIHPLDSMNQAASQDAYDKSIASLPTTNPDNDPPAPTQGAAPTNQDTVQTSQALPNPDPDMAGAGAPVGPTNLATQGAPIPTGAPVDVMGAYNQGQKAISETQSVQAQLAKNQAAIQQQDIDDRKDLNDTFQKNTQDFQAQQKQFMSDYMNNHIDPNHYMENMSSGQKVATGIGLFLGGFSSAFTHQGNPAMDFLNKQIDRDIQGQKDRIDQQKTILGANQELYHDQLLANNATRINMNDIYDHKIQLAATQLGTPTAKAQADAAHSQFALANAALLQQSATRATTLQALRNGGIGIDPVALGNAGFMSPEQAQKEQASIDKQKTAIGNVNNLYDQANKEQTTGNLLNPQSYRRIDQINASLRDAILATDTAHRVSPELQKTFLDPYLIKTTDTAETRAQKQNGALQKIKELNAGETPITERLAPGALPQYGLAQPPQHKVGDIVYTSTGQKGQVLADGRIKAVR